LPLGGSALKGCEAGCVASIEQLLEAAAILALDAPLLQQPHQLGPGQADTIGPGPLYREFLQQSSERGVKALAGVHRLLRRFDPNSPTQPGTGPRASRVIGTEST
jgi:hypothetical protein